MERAATVNGWRRWGDAVQVTANDNRRTVMSASVSVSVSVSYLAYSDRSSPGRYAIVKTHGLIRIGSNGVDRGR